MEIDGCIRWNNTSTTASAHHRIGGVRGGAISLVPQKSPVLPLPRGKYREEVSISWNYYSTHLSFANSNQFNNQASHISLFLFFQFFLLAPLPYHPRKITYWAEVQILGTSDPIGVHFFLLKLISAPSFFSLYIGATPPADFRCTYIHNFDKYIYRIDSN